MTDNEKAIIEHLVKKYACVEINGAFVSLGRNAQTPPHNLSLLYSPSAGGSYQFAGAMSVSDGLVLFRVYTFASAVYRTSAKKKKFREFAIDYADPELFSKIDKFISSNAKIFTLAYEIHNRRVWGHYGRSLAKQRIQDAKNGITS